MQLSITYRLTNGDRNTVDITPVVWIRWERRFKTKISLLDRQGLGYEDLAYLAFEAARAAGQKTPPTFDTFCDQLAELDTDGVTENPTNPGASAD